MGRPFESARAQNWKERKAIRHSIAQHLRSTFLSGILLIVPLVLTFLILKSLFLWLDGFAQPLARRLWGISFPGFGIVLSILFLYGAGLVSTNIVGRAFVNEGEKWMLKIPLVKVFYQSFKQFLQVFLSQGKASLRGRVVLVEYPMKGFRSVGFETNRCVGKDGRTKRVVLIPTVPNPTNGFLAVFPESEVTETDWTLEEASKFIFSAGILGQGGKK